MTGFASPPTAEPDPSGPTPPSPPMGPSLVGIGLNPQHYSEVLGLGGDANLDLAKPAWVEIHPQNYFADGGPARRWLAAVAEHYAISFHSTGLSLGSAEGPDQQQLDALARLCEEVPPAMVSDHVSWSVTGSETFPDLLPVPYTQDALDVLARSIDTVQERLGRTMLVENPSRYLAFANDEMDETTFLHRLCAMTGCGLIFDINNVVVSAGNCGLNAAAMVDAIDPALVGEIHLAGHAIEDHGEFQLRIDDHGSLVDDDTWALYARFIARAGPKPTLIEWDTDTPDYATLMGEAGKAEALIEEATRARAA